MPFLVFFQPHKPSLFSPSSWEHPHPHPISMGCACNWCVCIAFLALADWPRDGQQTKDEPIRFSLPQIRNWDPKFLSNSLATTVMWECGSQRQLYSNKSAKKWRWLSGRGQNKAHELREAETGDSENSWHNVSVPRFQAHSLPWVLWGSHSYTLVQVSQFPCRARAHSPWSLCSQFKCQLTCSFLPLLTLGDFIPTGTYPRALFYPVCISWGKNSIAQNKFLVVYLVGPCFIPSWDFRLFRHDFWPRNHLLLVFPLGLASFPSLASSH